MAQKHGRIFLSAVVVASAVGAFASVTADAQDLQESGCTYDGAIACRMEQRCIKWEGNSCTRVGPLEWVFTSRT